MNGDNVRVSANVPRTAGCDGDGIVSPTNYSPPYYHIPLYQYYTTTTPYPLMCTGWSVRVLAQTLIFINKFCRSLHASNNICHHLIIMKQYYAMSIKDGHTHAPSAIAD